MLPVNDRLLGQPARQVAYTVEASKAWRPFKLHSDRVTSQACMNENRKKAATAWRFGASSRESKSAVEIHGKAIAARGLRLADGAGGKLKNGVSAQAGR